CDLPQSDRTYAVALSNASLACPSTLRPFDPSTGSGQAGSGQASSGQAGSGCTAAWYFPLHLSFFRSASEKTKNKKKEKYRCEQSHLGHRVSTVSETSAPLAPDEYHLSAGAPPRHARAPSGQGRSAA